MAFFGKFKKSAAELKDLRCLVITAILIALDLVLKFFVGIQITEDLKLSFAFIAIASIGMLYGPTVAGLSCVVTDVLGYLLKPTGSFSPLFTLVEVAGGVLYGVFLYGMNPVKLNLGGAGEFFKSILSNWKSALRVVLAKVSVAVVCNLIMTPLFITVNKTVEAGVFNAGVFWAGFITRIGTRLIKNSIEIPIHCLLLLLTLFPIYAAYRGIFKIRNITES